MSAAPAFTSASEALEMVHAGLRFLADADATEMAAEEQASCLLGAFTAGKGYSADADYSPRADAQDRDHPGAAVSHTAWSKRAVAHPEVFGVLAAGQAEPSSRAAGPGRPAGERAARCA